MEDRRSQADHPLGGVLTTRLLLNCKPDNKSRIHPATADIVGVRRDTADIVGVRRDTAEMIGMRRDTADIVGARIMRLTEHLRYFILIFVRSKTGTV